MVYDRLLEWKQAEKNWMNRGNGSNGISSEAFALTTDVDIDDFE